MRRALLTVLAVALAMPAPPSAADEPGPPEPRPGATHAVPLHGPLLKVYDAPDSPYAPGHRGVKVGAGIGTPVRASADGVVSFAGVVAGNRSVTVDHGNGLRTTASYLADLAVVAGDPVQRGDVVGWTGEGKPDEDLPPHVHLSARRDDRYFDPLELYLGDAYDDLLSLVA